MRVPLFLIAFFALAAAADGSSFLRDALSYLRRGCVATAEDLGRCLERDLSRSIDGLMTAGNGTSYRLNGYLTVDVVRPANGRGREGTGDDGLAARISDLIGALRVRYRPMGAEDFAEGRGKKKKDKKNKMGIMMGAAAMGMTIIGGMATKMMMGGVTMIAMKALIIAKLALLLASVIALKKLIGNGGGSAGGVSSGPVWSSGGGGGGGVEAGGYRRSYGVQADDGAEHSLSAANGLAYRDQIGNSYGRSNSPRL